MELLIFAIISFLAGYYLGQRDTQGGPHIQADSPSPQPLDQHTQQEEDRAIPEGHTPKQLDTVSVLLYFGAFLVIAGVGLFVGLTDIAGNIKTVAVLLTALLFYSAGLLMYELIERLRPAAVAFAAIGLICLPLTGAAIYAYITDQQSGAMLWFGTSVICLALYVLAMWRMRQSFIGYLSVFMCLSLWLSIAAIIDAPVHFFGWFMVTLGILYVLTARYLRVWDELKEPLNVVATVMVPTALITTILFGFGSISPGDQGITLLLGSAFYAVSSYVVSSQTDRLYYFILSIALLPLGASAVIYGVSDSWIVTATSVSALATVGVLILAALTSRIPRNWLQSALQVSALTLAGAAIVGGLSFDWNVTAWLISTHIVIHAAAAFYFRAHLHMASAFLGVLLLPSIIGQFVLQPEAPDYLLIIAYLLVGLGILATRNLFARVEPHFGRMARISYALAWCVMLLFGLAANGWVPSFAFASVALATLLSAYIERTPLVIYIAAALGGWGVVYWLDWQELLQSEMLATALGAVGIAYYVISKMHLLRPFMAAYISPWRASGIIGMYIAAGYSLFQIGTNWPGVIVLALAGAITAYEAFVRKERGGIYAGGGVVLLAMQCGMYHVGMQEWLLYWHMWAFYFAALAWLSHRQNRLDDKKTFIFLALAAQSLPLAWWALQGDTGYGLILLLESVALLLFGLLLRYRMIWQWGLVAAVASVLYQLRDFQFFVLVILGAGVIGIGVFMLLRAEKHKD